jgi:ubiquitin carboxyl-terminal hydrolase 9/24
MIWILFQIVEKTDLMGLDFLWELCLNTPDETIADSAIQLLLNMSYTNLASRMKKVNKINI